MAKYRLGVDVGGTFTDALLAGDGTVKRAKVLTTPDDQSIGVLAAIGELRVPMSDIESFCHGYTVGINALLQRNGPKTALLCTEGQRELLDMAKLERPAGEELYDPTWLRPHQLRPLVRRRYRRGISERLLYDGSVHVPLDEAQVRREVAFLRSEGVQSIAVCLLHSFVNMAHENRIVEIIREVFPEVYLQSSSARPLLGEYDRTCAVVLNAYTGPVISSYLRNLQARLGENGYLGKALIMQMNGGVRTIERTLEHLPAYTIESGPVAGLLGAECYARDYLATRNLVCVDIGGTTTDIGIIHEGKANETEDWEAEFGIRLGYPAVEVRSVGAGGGSLIYVDEMGTLHVGPESAGARPGPACYGLGGDAATMTDAFLALGIMLPDRFLGGRFQLDHEQALVALRGVAERLDMEVTALADGALRLMNANIENEISKMAFDLALDLREFSLLAYGGAGPLSAALVARNLGIPEVIVPFFPAGFAALGMVAAPMRAEAATSVMEPIDAIAVERLEELFRALEAQVVEDLVQQGVVRDQIVLEREMRGMYAGQRIDDPIAIDAGEVTKELVERWKADYHAFCQRIYGAAADELPIIATRLRIVGSAPASRLPLAKIASGGQQPEPRALLKRARVFVEGAYCDDVPFYSRKHLLAGNQIAAPAVIDDEMSTVLVIAGSRAEVDAYGNIVIKVHDAEAGQRRRDEQDQAVGKVRATSPAVTDHHHNFMSAEDVERQYGIDLVTAETIRAGLIEVTRHMNRCLTRSSFSPIIRDALDFGISVHLVEPEGTEMVATTEGCVHFAFIQQHLTNMVLDEWGIENLGPGDTIVVNDSWRGAIHFSDINFLRPVFWEGQLAFVLGDSGHLMDLGGSVHGGFSFKRTSYFEEGPRIPPMLITSGDKPVRSTINLLLENTRMPRNMLGDIRAMFGTLKIGEERLARLLQRHGLEAVRAVARYTLDLSERRMRQAIRQVPDGDYEAAGWFDDDGLTEKPVKIRASARKRGSHVEIDFSGSSRQPEGAATTCWMQLSLFLIGSKLIFDPRHPMNAGAMRPFHTVAPAGTVITGLPPTSQTAHYEVASTAANVSIALFGRMLPEKAIAPESGASHGVIAVGLDTRRGRVGIPWGTSLSGAPSWGGTHSNDGISFCLNSIWNVRDVCIELLERDNPIVVRSRDLLPDGAGPGQFRSGYSGTWIIEAPHGTAFVSSLTSGGRFVREGLNGGAGMTSYVFRVRKTADNRLRQINGVIPFEDLIPLAGNFDAQGQPDPEHGEWCRATEWKSTKSSAYPLQPGEVIFAVGPTGGGYGNPLDRDPERVQIDVADERLSPEFAKRAYGVVIDRSTLEIDYHGTLALRSALRERQARGEWSRPVGGLMPWPKTWEELRRSSIAGTPAPPSKPTAPRQD